MEEFLANDCQCDIVIDTDNTTDMPKSIIEQINSYIRSLNDIVVKSKQNFMDCCFYVYHMKKLFGGYICYDKKGIMLQFDSIMQSFNFSSKDVNLMFRCYEKYYKTSVGDVLIDFNKSKLIELLTMPDEQLIADINNKVLRQDMSVKAIRNYVKNYKSMQITEDEDSESFADEDIPMAYNPKQHYDFEYFETKSKAQLLNIVWELQKEYERTRKEIRK